MLYEQMIIAKLKEILDSVPSDLQLEDDLRSFGLDSLKSVQLIVELEEMLGITFDDEEIMLENFVTVKSINELVTRANKKVV